MRELSVNRSQKGFSLVEVIVVIAILAILTGALAVSLTRYVARSKRTVDVTTADEIVSAIERTASVHPDIALNATESFKLGSTTMKTENTATTIMEFALLDFEQVPVSRWDENCWWTVTSDPTTRRVKKVYLGNSSGDTACEVYPNSTPYIAGDALP